MTADQALTLTRLLSKDLPIGEYEKTSSKLDLDRKIQVAINNEEATIQDFSDIHENMVNLLNKKVITQSEQARGIKLTNENTLIMIGEKFDNDFHIVKPCLA